MKHAVFANQALADKVRDFVRRHHGFPRCHCPEHEATAQHVGTGPHPMCTCSDPSTPGHCPYVTSDLYQWLKHPTLSQWAHPMPDWVATLIKGKLADAVAEGRITSAQATLIGQRIDARAELSADWTPTETP